MPAHRPERVAEMILRELAVRLRTEIKDDRVGPVSITHIDVTRDLGRAVVDYLPLGGGKPSRDFVEGLSDAAKKLRGPIGRALRLRHAPEIVFRYDAKAEDTFRLMGVLDRLSAERRAGAADEAAVTDEVGDTDAGTEGEE